MRLVKNLRKFKSGVIDHPFWSAGVISPIDYTITHNLDTENLKVYIETTGGTPVQDYMQCGSPNTGVGYFYKILNKNQIVVSMAACSNINTNTDFTVTVFDLG